MKKVVNLLLLLQNKGQKTQCISALLNLKFSASLCRVWHQLWTWNGYIGKKIKEMNYTIRGTTQLFPYQRQLVTRTLQLEQYLETNKEPTPKDIQKDSRNKLTCWCGQKSNDTCETVPKVDWPSPIIIEIKVTLIHSHFKHDIIMG